MSALYISFLTTYAPGRFQIVGILDDAPSMLARSVAGTRVLGRTDHFLPLLHEFREHGVLISRLLIGSDTEALTEEEHAEIERICREFEIQFDFIPCLVGLADLKSHATLIASQPDTCNLDLAVPTRQYVHLKRGLDLVLATVLMVLSAPFVPFVMALVLLDVGSPVLFWQRRVGLNGRSFQLYKFRTLKPSYDQFGSPVADGRASWVGALLRRLRLDELPQLMNVIVGDMSLIGPRPLLPKDQPRDPRLRLSVRPGITGWAQVNGGTLLTADQKSRLDEWYVRNSSFRIDMTILWRTIVVLFRGERAPVEAPVLAELQSVAADGGSSGSSPAEVSVA